MPFLSEMDKKTKQIGLLFIIYSLTSLIVLATAPLEKRILSIMALVLVIIALLMALIFPYKALKLYGRKSAEGKIWHKITIMFIIMTIGITVSRAMGLRSDHMDQHVYAGFVIVSFLLVTWAIFQKTHNAGLYPSIKDIVISILVVFIVFTFIAIQMMRLSDMGLSNFSMSDMIPELMAVAISFLLLFQSVIMSRLAGGHISRGWSFLALGCALFSIYYSLSQTVQIMGLRDEYIFLDALGIMSLNAVAFSAYYQRHMHLKLIEDMM
ncbi:MAG: hypothetical protein KAT70_06385 [Thermoplasmata archaeon]|nr:hypothetical protein [Thermoplasmata archaeon]